jgi:Helix-hairpin-helix motif
VIRPILHRRRSRPRPGLRSIHDRRALALAATLLVLVLASLAAVGAMALIDARVSAAGASWARMQMRALVWSGVQAAAAELAAQRERMLLGETPVITRTWTMPLDQGRVGRIWLESLSEPGDTGSTNEAEQEAGVLAPEGGKLDLNRVTAAMLAKLPGMDGELAQRIVALRPADGYDSVADLVTIVGLPSERVFGATSRAASEVATSTNQPDVAVLSSWLTVGLRDWNRQAGLGPGGARFKDEPRGDDPSALREALEGRLDADVLSRLDTSSMKPARQAEDRSTIAAAIVEATRAMSDPSRQAEAAMVLLDAWSWTSDDEVLGMTDVFRAPREVLASIPGFDEVLADRAFSLASGLPEADRASLWWLARDVLTREQFAQASSWLTTRTLQWRVRVGAQIESTASSDEPSSDLEPSARMGVMAYEAVIDVAGALPRIAYLREVTNLDAASSWAESLRARTNAQMPEVSLAGPPGEPQREPSVGPLLGISVRAPLDESHGIDVEQGGLSTAPSDGPVPEASGREESAVTTARSRGRWRARPRRASARWWTHRSRRWR